MNNHDTINGLEKILSLLDKQREAVNRVLNCEYFRDPLLKNLPQKQQTTREFMEPSNKE